MINLDRLNNPDLRHRIDVAQAEMDAFEALHDTVRKEELEPVQNEIEKTRSDMEKARKKMRMSEERFKNSEAYEPFKQKLEELKEKELEALGKFPNLNIVRDKLYPLQQEAYDELVAQSGLDEEDYRRETMFEAHGIDPTADKSGFIFPDGRMIEISHKGAAHHNGDTEWLCDHFKPDTVRTDLTAHSRVLGEGNVRWNVEYNEFVMDFDHKLSPAQEDMLDMFVNHAKANMRDEYDRFTLIVDQHIDGRHEETTKVYHRDDLDTNKVLKDIENIQNGLNREKDRER